MGIFATLIIGAIAGWLGGKIYKGSGLGLLGNIIVGILGSGVGSWLLEKVLNISLGEGWIGSIITGAIGAIVILFLINLIFKKKD
ncbi:GlsB/YeaQ/YmgE family stress response membrane protein [Hoylesella nanceiensis]|jgi:membrane protein|uniref:GlsB/YeaQ/YmgE family stress response membrane protein n=1 Tax=Hoylesella nanceiensis TaxID=425941 RepID=UPI00243125EF|nr:GlsB/YeaQ/YmgE family stress response membrane protein [Hoylesella nanceiensis]